MTHLETEATLVLWFLLPPLSPAPAAAAPNASRYGHHNQHDDAKHHGGQEPPVVGEDILPVFGKGIYEWVKIILK